MSPARARRSARRGGGRGAGRGGPRFRRLVDAWRADRQERTPMQHGTRVASIEADLGADMIPGRQARWERLEIDRDDPGMALEDAWFRSALDDVVPADAPDREARIEAAVDLARERFLAHGQQTWPQEALDLLDQQPAQDQQHDERQGVEHDDQPSAVSDQPDRNTDREVSEQQQDADQQDGPAAAGAGEHTEPAQAPHPGRQAQRFETELFSGAFGGAAGQHQQIGDAANEIDHQQRPKTERPETERPETDGQLEREIEDEEPEP